jgi:hypothetical protein
MLFTKEKKEFHFYYDSFGGVHGFHEGSFLVFMINLDTIEQIVENLVGNYAGIVTILCDDVI